MNFETSIFDNKTKRKTPFLAAHRGVCGANVPCNTLLAYKIAVDQGADIVEIDVAKSADGKFYVFHPGMEYAYLKTGKLVSDMDSAEVLSTPILNCDEAKTHYRIPTLREVLALLKDKVYINVDKYWTDVRGITEEIRAAGVEKQVIVKTSPDEKLYDEIEKYAPDFMYMTMAWHKDDVTPVMKKRNINYVGIEALFDKLDDEIASEKYVADMHKQGLLVWGNSIIYDETAVISGGLTDDISLEKGGDFGWGKLRDRGFDIIQTDWLLPARLYLEGKSKA